MSTSNEEPNLRSCSASDLSNFLFKHRFGGDEVATTTFLLQSMESLPNALETASKLQQQQQQIEKEETPAPDHGKEIVPSTSFSFLTPRGKMETTLYEQGLEARNAKNEALFLPIGSVQQIIIFPKSTTTNNNKTAFVVLVRLLNETETTTTFKNKKLSQICWTMEGASLSEQWVANLCACLGVDSAIQVASSKNGWSFQSHQDTATSTTTGGRPFVKCYHGVNDGVLYPLKEGLLFFKPPLFVARSEMVSISCGRGGNTGSSRYVDMVVQVERDTIEFTNIHREELQGLNDYIHKVLIPAMQQDVVTHSSEAGKDDTTASEPVDLVETNNEDDDDSDEDEDYQSGNSDDEEEDDDNADEDEGVCLEDEDETESESELPPPAKKRSRRG